MQTTATQPVIRRPMSDLHFRMMTIGMKFRDVFRTRRDVLQEASILRGDRVLDYGCGPGSYIPDVSKRVGRTGRVYALDAHPLSIQRIKSMTERNQFTNVETIHSNCQTGLPADSIDIVLLYDVFHMLDEPHRVLTELHRVLRDNGNLSFSDHHMNHEDIVAGVTGSGLFTLSRQGEHTYCFAKDTST